MMDQATIQALFRMVKVFASTQVCLQCVDFGDTGEPSTLGTYLFRYRACVFSTAPVLRGAKPSEPYLALARVCLLSLINYFSFFSRLN